MTSQERVLFTLRDLFVEELPGVIRELNAEYDDGFILPELSGVVFFGGSLRLPYAVLRIADGEETEKDRIIRNVVYAVSVEFVVAGGADTWRLECRYGEAVRWLVERNREVAGVWEWAEVCGTCSSIIHLAVELGTA